MGSTTIAQEDGATKCEQFEHCCPSLGVPWYFDMACESFICCAAASPAARQLSETAVAATTGAPFKSERREIIFLNVSGIVIPLFSSFAARKDRRPFK
jgi:hypothetical protein